jgi:hypothetical protein
MSKKDKLKRDFFHQQGHFLKNNQWSTEKKIG